MADLAALTPPLLVCAAFLVAIGAFIRHEMRRNKNPADDEDSEVSTQISEPDSAGPGDENLAAKDAVSRSVDDHKDG